MERDTLRMLSEMTLRPGRDKAWAFQGDTNGIGSITAPWKKLWNLFYDRQGLSYW